MSKVYRKAVIHGGALDPKILVIRHRIQFGGHYAIDIFILKGIFRSAHPTVLLAEYNSNLTFKTIATVLITYYLLLNFFYLLLNFLSDLYETDLVLLG